MGKDIYLAGKVNSGEFSIIDFSNELEQRGHRVIEKWWEKETLPKPYLDYPETSIPASEAMVNAAYESDVYILFPENNILGAAVELGVAIASVKNNPEKQVLIINPEEVRQSVFYIHPVVVAVNGIKQIRKMEWY